MKKNRRTTTTFASYRLFELLKFLSKTPATIPEIIEHLSSVDPAHRKYTSITIYKYFNTLRAMGLPLKKVNYKYILESLPFSFNFSEDDVKAIKVLAICAEHMPEKSIKNEIVSFLNTLSPTISKEKKDYYKSLNIDEAIFENQTKEDEKLISDFEKYSKDALKVVISYRYNKSNVKTITVEPLDITYNEGKIYFKVYDAIKGNIIKINLKKVISISQSAQKSKGVFIPTTVTYKVKGRLKDSYVLRDCETLSSTSENEAIIINKGEDKAELLSRLFGYCDLCEIISPKVYRDEMIEELNCMLKNYI